jgi:hypothetical protein
VYKDSTSFDRTTVTVICEDMRAKVESGHWKGRAGKTDWAIILTALDIAQHCGRLEFFLDARSASFAAGVSPITASRSLGRVVKAGWLIASPHNSIAPRNRVPVSRANEYAVNPALTGRHVYKFCYLPHPSGDDPSMRTESSPDGTESISLSTGEITGNLITILSDGSNTYTHGDQRRALLIGRTNTGVELGVNAVWLTLKADDTPRSVKELSALAGVDHSTAGKIIRRKLAPAGLLVNTGGEWFALDDHPGGGWWEGGKWSAGIPLSEYNPNSDRVGNRVARIANDRRERGAQIRRAENRWIAAELRKAEKASKINA